MNNVAKLLHHDVRCSGDHSEPFRGTAGSGTVAEKVSTASDKSLPEPAEPGKQQFLDPGLNYYRNVRPEQEWRQGLQKQDKELQSLAQQFNKARSAASDAAAGKSIRSTLNTTGHSTSFQNSGGYFGRRQ